MMKNTIFYLIAFPGTGKYTIAKELARQEDIKLVDAHLINNPVFSLIGADGITPLPPNTWDYVSRIWDAVLDTMTDLSPADYNFVLTNYLSEKKQLDKDWFETIAAMAAKRKATLVPIRLTCAVDEHKKRIVRADRAERLKEINPKAPDRYATEDQLITLDHPHTLTLDITDIPAAEAAATILAHAKSL